MLKCFAEKNVSSFCSAKATQIFSAKYIRISYIESAKTVNEMTLKELVKLMMLCTPGPRCIGHIKRKGILEHAKKYIYIIFILRMRKSSSGHLPSTDRFYSDQ